MKKKEFEKELDHIINFWSKLNDPEFGGFYGVVDYDLNIDKKADKGCILMSRILWFYSNAYLLKRDPDLLEYAASAFEFLRDYCVDQENGGVYWSVTYDGKPKDDSKHTYCISFVIYALTSYFDASNDYSAIDLAYKLQDVMEDKCKDEFGYLEAMDVKFNKISNDKLSENGVIADRTMNTLLHILEAYTELYRVTDDARTYDLLRAILYRLNTDVYDEENKFLRVFFDNDYNSIIDLQSYGHDIEASWLIYRSLEILQDEILYEKYTPMVLQLADTTIKAMFIDGRSMPYECEKGKINTNRVWWTQAEAIIGFYNANSIDHKRKDYLEASEAIWEFTKDKMIDSRENGCWYNELDASYNPIKMDIVNEWKCPYHNGRMCIEMIRRLYK